MGELDFHGEDDLCNLDDDWIDGKQKSDGLQATATSIYILEIDRTSIDDFSCSAMIPLPRMISHRAP